jgi:hypothetical protein
LLPSLNYSGRFIRSPVVNNAKQAKEEVKLEGFAMHPRLFIQRQLPRGLPSSCEKRAIGMQLENALHVDALT